LEAGDAEVGAGDFHELVVGAALDDAAVFHDNDEIGAAERAEAVGDDEGGAAGDGAIEGGEDLVFGFGIDRGGGIVEEENRRFEEDGAGDGETLALSAGKAAAALAEDGVVALGELGDEIVGGGDFGGAFDLVARGLGVAEGDVGGDGVGEEEAFLEDDADVAAEVVEVEAAGVDAVDEHGAGGGIVEARDETHQDALAGAGGAEDGDALAGLDVERDVVEDGFGLAEIGRERRQWMVDERHAIEADVTVQARAVDGVGGVLDFDGGVEDFEDAAGADERLLDGVNDGRDVVNLAGELFEETGEDDEAGAERELAVDDEPTAVAEQDHHVDAREEADGGGEEADAPENGVLLFEAGAIGGFEFGAVFLLAAEALGDGDALDALGEILDHLLDERAVLRVGGLDFFGEPGGETPEERRGGEAGERERGAETRHVNDVDGERDDHDHALDQDLVDEHADGLNVAGDARDDGARGVGVEEAEGETLELVVDLAAEIDDELLLDEFVDGDEVGVVEECAGKREDEDEAGEEAEDLLPRPVVGERDVKRVGRERDAGDFVADVVDADAGETETADAHREEDELDREDFDAAGAVMPRQREQPPDQLAVGGAGGGVGWLGCAHASG